MGAWSSAELAGIDGADEIRVTPRRGDGGWGKVRTVWVVRAGDDLYVRSVRGTAGGWYRAISRTSRGRISAYRIDKDVTFTAENDPGLNEQLDAAYLTKYASYPESVVNPMVAQAARATTLRLVPADEE